MRTVDTSVTTGRLTKMRTDVALFVRLLRMLYGYATAGRRIRVLYRRAEGSGQPLWVDDLAESERRLG